MAQRPIQDEVAINATTRNKNVVTDAGIERHPEQPAQAKSPAARENQNSREPDPDTPKINPAVTSPVK